MINKYQTGGIFNTLDKYAEQYEPAAATISLGGLGVGAATSMTGVDAPIGGTIALVSQIPSTVIDGYQAARDWYKTANGDNRVGSAIWNTIETGLDVLGGKAAKNLAKQIAKGSTNVFNPNKMPTSPKRRIAKHLQASWRNTYNYKTTKASKQLAKKGIHPNQGAYYEKKLKDILTKNYQIEKEEATNNVLQYVPKITPYIAAPINIVPNMLDIINK